MYHLSQLSTKGKSASVGIKIQGKSISILRFADDIAVPARSIEELKRAFSEMENPSIKI